MNQRHMGLLRSWRTVGQAAAHSSCVHVRSPASVIAVIGQGLGIDSELDPDSTPGLDVDASL